MIIGNDGGTSVTVAGGGTWSTQLNQPTAAKNALGLGEVPMPAPFFRTSIFRIILNSQAYTTPSWPLISLCESPSWGPQNPDHPLTPVTP